MAQNITISRTTGTRALLTALFAVVVYLSLVWPKTPWRL